MSDRRENLEEHREALEAFMHGPAFVGYKAAVTAEISELERRIIDFIPVTREDEIESYMLRGELRRARETFTTFEDAARTLEDRINDALDLETKTGTNRDVK
jgi:hypothetical protein